MLKSELLPAPASAAAPLSTPPAPTGQSDPLHRRKPPELKAITGARGLAALWVIILHLYDFLPRIADWVVQTPWTGFLRQGYLGVDFFFILSGFVLSLSYHKANVGANRRNYLEFLTLRIARVYPAHLFTLLVMAVLAAASLRATGKPPEWASVRSFFGNLFLVQAWTFPTMPSWNIPSWSVSAEWLAYLTFPLSFWAASQFITTATRLIGVAILLSLLILSVPIFQFTGTAAYGIIRIATEFPTGCLLYGLYSSGLGGALFRQAWFSNFFHAFCFLGLLLVAWCAPLLDFGQVYAVPLLALGVYSLTFGGGWLSRLLTTPAAQFLGRASYSIYLVQLPCLLVVNRLRGKAVLSFPAECGMSLFFLVAIVLSGSLVYLAVEEPCRRLIKRKSGALFPNPAHLRLAA